MAKDMKPLVAPLFLVATCLGTATAQADVSRDDEPKAPKYVPYEFVVHGHFSDDPVFYPYPCGLPAPLAEGTRTSLVEGSQCSIYMISKTAFDTWHNESPYDSAKLTSLSTQCAGGPTPVTKLDGDDDRSRIQEDLDVEGNGSSCAVRSRGVPSASDDDGGCNVSGSRSVPVALLLGVPAAMLLFGRRRRK